jgi:hypothetical protein
MQNKDLKSTKTNLPRRFLGLTICLLPFAVAIASIVIGFLNGKGEKLSGIWFLIAALAIAFINFYLSFLRFYVFKFMHNSTEGCKHESGLPVIGTILAVVGIIQGFGAIIPAIMGITILFLDTGGLPWFLFCTWKDSSFWDEKHS